MACIETINPLYDKAFVAYNAPHFEINWRSVMAVPKRKTTPSKRGMRRSAHALLSAPNYVENPDSGELHRRHHIDLKSGMYRGRQVLEPKD